MKNFIYPFIIGLIFLSLQSSIFYHSSIYGIRPNFILIEIVFLGSYRKVIEGVIISMGLGYIVDILSGNIIGLNMLLGVINFSFIKFISSRLIITNYTFRIILVFIATVIHFLGSIIIFDIFFIDFKVKFYSMIIMLGIEIFVNSIFTYPVWIILKKIEKFNVEKFFFNKWEK